jgi:very-short-patch-repair endonuclease
MERKKEDDERTQFLETQGYRVLRFWNNQVLKDTEAVLEVILKKLKEK